MAGVDRSRRKLLQTAAAGGLGAGLATSFGAVAPARAEGVEGTRAREGAEGGAEGSVRVAVLLYDGFTALDAVGPYEVLCRVPGVTVTMVAERAGRVRTDTGELGLVAERSLDSVARADVLLVPGGVERGTTATMANTVVLDWIRRIHRGSTWTTSVCTGSLILGAAGLLRGVPATTYWASRPYLADAGAIYTPGRFVEAGKILTGAGVSAGIDMGLHLAARLSDERTAQAMQLAVEYDPDPPFDTGSPEKAGPELQQLALKLIADAVR
ncbi:DJ-1/PfpI family protein [Streptomyces iranensis]|uniref:Intracellular protease/amidase n=1 Tax=Streptomyces iranensis TaxID=576784 RepID=A0ABS4ML45_9ACTN|nr:DJ-1/PfpI family protein [Streptomyces iranensis]MBP2060434.1 putative intracellular protease/amidase [Streptomyces iranensis]